MSLSGQKIELDEQKLILTISLVFFIITSGFLYVQNQELTRLSDTAEAEMTSARQDAEEAENTVENQIENINELRSQVQRLEEENNDLTIQATEYIVEARYKGITENETVNVEITNYGEQPTNITATCQGREQNADQYQSFEFNLNNFTSQTRENREVTSPNNIQVQNLVNIQCKVEECSGNCIETSNIL